MKKFVSEIFKRTGSGGKYADEASHIKGFVKSNIQDKYNITPKTSPVYYADMLLPITKNIHDKK